MDEQAERHRRYLDQHRIAFIDTDLDVAIKSVVRAATELSLGHHKRADELLFAAVEAHRRISTFLVEVDDTEQQQRLRDKHQTLADAIREAGGTVPFNE